MSNTRPYLVTVGGGEKSAYMVNATTPGQALRIVAGGYPAPVLNAKAATGSEVMDWVKSGRPLYDKDNFAADLPATVVLYADAEGRIAAAEDFTIKPGFYYLHVEPMTGEDEPGTPDAAEAPPTDAGGIVDDALEQIQVAGEQVLEEVVDDKPAGKGKKTLFQRMSDSLPRADGHDSAQAPEAGAYDPYIQRGDTDAEGEPVDADADMGEEAPRPGRPVSQPRFHGAFNGDTYRGDPEDAERVTHVWGKGKWTEV